MIEKRPHEPSALIVGDEEYGVDPYLIASCDAAVDFSITAYFPRFAYRAAVDAGVLKARIEQL